MHARLTPYHVKSVVAIPPYYYNHDEDSVEGRQNDDLHPWRGRKRALKLEVRKEYVVMGQKARQGYVSGSDGNILTISACGQGQEDRP